MKIPVILLTLMLLAFTPPEAEAHKVALFAWEEGGKVRVEGRYFGGGRIAGGTLSVFDAQETLLLEGKTDGEGTFDFETPNRPLLLVLETVDGHRAQFPLDGAAPVNATEADTSGAPETEVAPPPATPEALQAAIEAALERRLVPVLRQLQQERERAGFAQIVGGLGYLSGLVGVAAFFASRRKDR